MTKPFARLSLLLAAAALQPATAFAQQPTAVLAASEADRQLKALYEGYSDWVSKEYGYFEDAKGESQQAGYLAKVDPASNLRRAAHLQSLLEQLDAIPAAQ